MTENSHRENTKYDQEDIEALRRIANTDAPCQKYAQAFLEVIERENDDE